MGYRYIAMPMKMARASEQDLEVAQQTASFIESLQKEWVPEAMESDDDVFDIEDPEQCQQVLRKLLEINDRGSIFRVTFGMLVLLDPANKLIDPDADTLEAHPDVTRLQAENSALQQRLTVADEQVDILSGGLRLMTSFGSGTNIAGVKTVAKQTLNRAAGAAMKPSQPTQEGN